jgi:AbrB family looped-hinge helix DNA binding protein
MPIVTVKSKFQVVIPQDLRQKIGIRVGDLLEAKVERGKVTFTPKSLIDRDIAESLEDFKRARSHGPFGGARDTVASLQREMGKRRARKRPAA